MELIQNEVNRLRMLPWCHRFRNNDLLTPHSDCVSLWTINEPRSEMESSENVESKNYAPPRAPERWFCRSFSCTWPCPRTVPERRPRSAGRSPPGPLHRVRFLFPRPKLGKGRKKIPKCIDEFIGVHHWRKLNSDKTIPPWWKSEKKIRSINQSINRSIDQSNASKPYRQ